MRRHFSYFFKAVFLFSVYFLTGRFGLSFDAVSEFAALVWLPSGIALFALLTFGYRLWPAILAAAFLVNYLQGASFLAAFGIGIGNSLEALIGVYLLKRREFKISLDQLSDIFSLVIIAAPISALVSATIGVFSLVFGGVIPSIAFNPTWVAWWLGDIISILLITPFLLVWRRLPRRITKKRIIEAGIITWILLGVSINIFFSNSIHIYPVTYLVFPPLIWASLRFSKREAVTATFVLAIIAIWGTALGLGPFAVGELNKGLLLLQTFMGVTTITSLILAVVAAERRELEQRKDDFISMASHELKTPLTTMQVFTHLLSKKVLKKHDKRESHYLDKIQIQIDKLNYLINELLDVSKMQAGELEFKAEQFSLMTIVKEEVENIRQTSSSHKFSIKFADKSRTYDVIADRERVSQVLMNLLTNAVKYSPNSPRVIVEIAQRRGQAVVSIKDFGRGIAPSDREKIFQRYYRVDKTFPGFGIGLYVSSEIIKHLGGEMWVTSKKGKGSQFYFTLPIA